MSQKKFDHQPPTYTYFLNISKKEEKKHRNEQRRKKKSNIHSHSFCLKKKKCFLPPHHLASKKIHPPIFFSLFKKWKKRKLIQEDARPFQIKEKINWTETSYKKSKHATKNLLEKNLRTENSTFKKKKSSLFFLLISTLIVIVISFLF